MSKIFYVEVTMDGADLSESPCWALSRILLKLAAQVDNHTDDGWGHEGFDAPLKDANGNTYGRAWVEDRPAQAVAMGRAFGESVGSWVIDGNTSEAQAASIIRGYDEGDPETLDMMPAPVSGWPLPHEVLDCYEAGYSDGYWSTVLEAARAIVGDDAADALLDERSELTGLPRLTT